MSVTKRAMVSILALTSSVTFAFASPAATLLNHRAIYDVKLIDADERSGVESMSGKMVYEFSGSACKGYKTDFRFVTTIGANGTTQVSDQRTTTFEDPDSQTLVFSTQTYTDDTLDKELEGMAEQKDGKVVVDITKPEEKDVALGQAIFPIKHMTEILARVARGEKLYETRLYDASDDADAVMVASTLMGQPVKTSSDDGELKIIGKYSGKRYWPITSTYHKTPVQNDSLPEYQMSMIMHDNGVTRDLTMRYNGFSLKGTLTKFEVLPQESCK